MINLNNNVYYHCLFNCYRLFGQVTFKVVSGYYQWILLPYLLINLLPLSIIEKINCDTTAVIKPPVKRLNQPFIQSEGDQDQRQPFLWAIVIIGTAVLIFLAICFCRCYYRYKEICDEQLLHNQQIDPTLHCSPSSSYQPSPSTIRPHGSQLHLPSVSNVPHQIKILYHAIDASRSTSTTRPNDHLMDDEIDQLSSIVLHHGRSSIKINPSNELASRKKELALRRQSSLRSSV